MANVNQVNQKRTKKRQFFSCEKCTFSCERKPDWERHIATPKHHKLTIVNTELIKKTPKHICSVCFKEYKSNVGLWKHSKKCTSNIIIEISDKKFEIIEKEDEEKEDEEQEDEEKEDEEKEEKEEKENDVDLKKLIIEILKSNNELQKQNNELQKNMFDLCKINTNTISNNTINSHNKTFNLQFFLNEQCKDAMNITDFANSFDLQLSDLETVGELGYVEGITKIIVDKLNSMDIYKRPMHCSDAKREIIYVKDENVWTKEEKDNPKLRQAIKNVSFRNMKLVYNWSNAYPESKNSESRLNDKYMELVIQSTGGNNPIVESENKIIRRIAKEIVIGKKNM